MRVPAIPNSPLLSPDDPDPTGEMRLRRNARLDFMENAAFDPAVAVYDDRYQNSQAHSPRFLAHMVEVQERIEAHLAPGARVVEVGCGKGAFFDMLDATGRYDLTGYDATYEGDNPRIEKRYLTGADRIGADLVILRHVLEHIQAPHRFLAMLAEVFDGAPIYIEVPNAGWITQNGTFFDITYEHVNYFSQAALTGLFRQTREAGLLFDGQYQYVIADLDTLDPGFGAAYGSPGAWNDLSFASLFPGLAQALSAMADRVTEGRRLFLWGAATKGCMYLVHAQAAGLAPATAAVDINPDKIGKYLPLSHVPIWPPERFMAEARSGDILMVMNPAYLPEIAARVRAEGPKGIEILAFGA